MSNLALTPQPIYRQSMQDLILQQALEHLDPERHGLSVTLAICVPPRHGYKVRSLLEIDGLGTPPWPRNLAEKPIFLGAESLVGYAVGNARSCVINSRDEVTFFSVHWTEHERSAGAFPILRQARVAGGLIVASAQEDFFTPPRISAIENYAHLAACAFELEDTFNTTDLELWMMPSYTLQSPYFADYNQRLSQKFAEVAAVGKQASLQQIRQLVWQDFEDVLLQVFLQTGMSSQS
jgi:hypothetical protein